MTIKILHKKSPHCPDLKNREQWTHKGYVLPYCVTAFTELLHINCFIEQYIFIFMYSDKCLTVAMMIMELFHNYFIFCTICWCRCWFVVNWASVATSYVLADVHLKLNSLKIKLMLMFVEWIAQKKCILQSLSHKKLQCASNAHFSKYIVFLFLGKCKGENRCHYRLVFKPQLGFYTNKQKKSCNKWPQTVHKYTQIASNVLNLVSSVYYKRDKLNNRKTYMFSLFCQLTSGWLLLWWNL